MSGHLVNTTVELPAGGFSYSSLAPEHQISPLYIDGQFSFSLASIAPGQGVVDVSAYSFTVLLKAAHFTQYHTNGQYAWHGLIGVDRSVISTPQNAVKTIWDTPIKALAIFISPTFVERLLGTHTFFDEGIGLGKYGVDDSVFTHIAHTMISYSRQWGDIDPLFAESAATMVVAHTSRCYTEQRPRQSRSGLNAHDLRAIKRYIHDHIAHSLSLASLASLVHRSPAHFSRLFKQATGHTPHTYVLLQRVEHAKALLRSGQLSLAEVGAAVGFAHQSHFIRVFRHFTGVTPAVFGDNRKN